VDFELEAATRRENRRVTFNRQARERYLAFATAPDATWDRNFRDLIAAVARMGTLAEGGRITAEVVDDEITRLRRAWGAPAGDDLLAGVLGEKAEQIDRFDAVQLAEVITVCRQSRSLSDAGRRLFAWSRTQRSPVNDADRLRKYLARFGLAWPV